MRLRNVRWGPVWMSRSGASQGRTRVWRVALVLICAPGPLVSAQVASAPSLPPLPPPRAEQAESTPLPPVFADPNQTRSRPAQPLEPPPSAGAELRPGILRRPLEGPVRPTFPEPFPQPDTLFRLPDSPPLGYTGPSGVMPTESQTSSHFVPIEDRWRLGFPEWDRYGKGHPLIDDYPYALGRLLGPYNQNVFKGDYPIIGQHTFLDVTA